MKTDICAFCHEKIYRHVAYDTSMHYFICIECLIVKIICFSLARAMILARMKGWCARKYNEADDANETLYCCDIIVQM